MRRKKYFLHFSLAFEKSSTSEHLTLRSYVALDFSKTKLLRRKKIFSALLRGQGWGGKMCRICPWAFPQCFF